MLEEVKNEEFQYLLKVSNLTNMDTEAFGQNVKCLKDILTKMYDFGWLNTIAGEAHKKRTDIYSFCEKQLAKKYGANMMDICEYNKAILTRPTKLENCPFPSENNVLYSVNPQKAQDIVSIDNHYYMIQVCKLEELGTINDYYYSLYCSLVEEVDVRRI